MTATQEPLVSTSPPEPFNADRILQPLKFPKVFKDSTGKLVVTPGAGLEVKNRIFRSSISGQFDQFNGTGSDVRIRWEESFAKGGTGTIISSFVPVRLDGRILPRYAMIHHDDTVPFWTRLIQRVHDLDCKYIIQLSHGGRQRDIPGVENSMTKGRSSTSKPDSFHGLLASAMTTEDIQQLIKDFGQGARRAQEANADGVELHSSHGYLFTQFLSSAINDRDDEWGGSLYRPGPNGEVHGRVKFLVEVIREIRKQVGWDFHVQAKLNILDRNRAYLPLEWKDGNTVQEALKVFEIAEGEGLNALHVSAGSTFPHPLVPPGGFPIDEAAWWYGAMAGNGTRAFTNLVLFRFPWLRWLFRLIWNRTKKEYPIEGVTAALCKLVKDEAIQRAKVRGDVVTPEQAAAGAMAHIPVLNTGGFQDGVLIDRLLRDGNLDGVSIARPLIANRDLVNKYFKHNKPLPEKPCTFCNRCLLNALANPLACYDLTRYESRDEMIKEAMKVFPDVYPNIYHEDTLNP